MAICALGYLGVRTPLLDEWSSFAGKLLGMQQVDRGGKTLAFRMDDRSQRLIVEDEPGETLGFIGWEVDDKDDLAAYAAKLEAAGYPVSIGPRALCAQRFVEELVYFDDPDGNRVEIVWNPARTPDPFVPGRPIEGFKTGPQGMGHVVLHTGNIPAMLHCYRDVLGFAISDFAHTPLELFFFHVNPRHHSFALVGSGKRGLHHFMVEFDNLDDVGQGYDVALHEQERVAFTLGRHTNDYMTSFYAHSPSGFFVENGWGGRLIRTETWEPFEMHEGPSFWGHERLYMQEAERSALREMRMKAARAGLRSPNMANCSWLYETAIP